MFCLVSLKCSCTLPFFFPIRLSLKNVPNKDFLLASIFCGAVQDLVTSFLSPLSTLTAAASGIDRYGICNSIFSSIVKCTLFSTVKKLQRQGREKERGLLCCRCREHCCDRRLFMFEQHLQILQAADLASLWKETLNLFWVSIIDHCGMI